MFTSHNPVLSILLTYIKYKPVNCSEFYLLMAVSAILYDHHNHGYPLRLCVEYESNDLQTLKGVNVKYMSCIFLNFFSSMTIVESSFFRNEWETACLCHAALHTQLYNLASIEAIINKKLSKTILSLIWRTGKSNSISESVRISN